MQTELTSWKVHEKFIFRFFFIYFLLQIIPIPVPNTIEHFKKVWLFDWAHLTFHDIRHIGAYHLNILKIDLYGSDFTNLFLVIAIALAGAIIWTFLHNKALNYNYLYYWLRVAVRYKLAAIMFAYAFIKLFPMQFPDPTVSQLHTYIGDMSITKFYWLSIGITKPFEIFSGSLELLGGLLLLHRRTTLLAALLISIVMINIELINFAYDINVKVYGAVILIMALFLTGQDLGKILRLVVFGKATDLQYFYPIFSKRFNIVRVVLKIVYFIFFFVLYFASAADFYKKGGYRYSHIPGITQGFYEVETFKWNNQVRPFTLDDTLRWENVAFEKWNTLSIKTRRPVYLPYDVTQFGRDFYSYKADTQTRTLSLEFRLDTNRNFKIQYSVPDTSTLILSGKIKDDSLYVKLRKKSKVYVLKTEVDERRKILIKRTQGERWIQ